MAKAAVTHRDHLSNREREGVRERETQQETEWEERNTEDELKFLKLKETSQINGYLYEFLPDGGIKCRERGRQNEEKEVEVTVSV